jgi:predicted DNA-binding transcriptional regulator YafY
MSESAIDRTARALDLIPYVTNNPGLSIAELAARFNSTPAQIFKDLEMIFMCGLPGYSHLELIDLELDEDYVAINNPQNLRRPRKLSFQEITALTLGLQSLLGLATDAQLAARVQTLADRMKSLLGDNDESRLSLFTVDVPFSRGEWDSLMLQGAQEGKAVRIEYLSARSDEVSERVIFPELIYRSGDFIYTKALCSSSREIRHFRHDRILKASADSAIRPPKSSTPGKYATTEKEDLKEQVVHVNLSRRNLFFIEAHSSIVESCELVGDLFDVKFRVGDSEWLLRALSSLPGELHILSPKGFREAYHARLDAILALYR